MKTLQCLIIVFSTSLSLFSCQSEREKKVIQINIQSRQILDNSINIILNYRKKINIDSIENDYAEISKDSAELRLVYARKIQAIASSITKNIYKMDSIAKAKEDKEYAIAIKKWEKSKAGRIQKKYPDWTVEDCERVANNRIWIGMSLDMIKYMRGNPNSANPSNYGNGTEWQWCWYDYTPSCFYGGEDQIITSYN